MTTPLWVVNTRLKLQGAKFRTQEIECSKTARYKGIIGKYIVHSLCKVEVTASKNTWVEQANK